MTCNGTLSVAGAAKELYLSSSDIATLCREKLSLQLYSYADSNSLCWESEPEKQCNGS